MNTGGIGPRSAARRAGHGRAKTGVRIALGVKNRRCAAQVCRSERVRWVRDQFGEAAIRMPMSTGAALRISLAHGSIVLISGPSGSGKSSLLRGVAGRLPAILVDRLDRARRGQAVIDTIAPDRPAREAMAILTACGLGEPRLWVRTRNALSDGERFRAGLARAFGRAVHGAGPAAVLCDEFTSGLHRRLARGIAFGLRRLCRRTGVIAFVATAQEDVARDLQPEIHIRMHAGRIVECERRGQAMETRPTFLRRARIERGSVRDYLPFAGMHYRGAGLPAFVDKVFVLRERAAGDVLGVVIYGHAPLELSLRNRAIQGRFRGRPDRLRRELRILRRLVIHPDVRGCGIGRLLVRRTLPMVGVRFVECLSAMGAVNPVFARAGMTPVGRCPPPRGRIRLVQRLGLWNVDPDAADFVARIRDVPRVRALVARTVRNWATANHAGMATEPRDRSAASLAATFRSIVGQPPAYFLWDRAGVYPRGGASSDKT